MTERQDAADQGHAFTTPTSRPTASTSSPDRSRARPSTCSTRRPGRPRGCSTWISVSGRWRSRPTPDGSTKWIFVQLTDFNGFAVVDFATHKEVQRIKNPDLPPGKATVPEGSDPSHGMAVTADGKTLVVCSRLNNYLYSYSLPDLKLIGSAELDGEGRGLGDAHAGREDRVRGQPGDQRRVGRRREDDEGGRRRFRSASCRSGTRRGSCSSGLEKFEVQSTKCKVEVGSQKAGLFTSLRTLHFVLELSQYKFHFPIPVNAYL